MTKNKIILVDDCQDLVTALVETIEMIIQNSDYTYLEVIYFNNPIEARNYILDNIRQICMIISDEDM
jgi:hypothetical protein